MINWRIGGQGWPESALEEQLDLLPGLERNFSDPPEQLTLERGWHQYSSESVIAEGRPGLPEENDFFERGHAAITNYEFSDPRIVIAHFDPGLPLMGRHILLEMRALRFLHYLTGVVVGDVRSEQREDKTVFGFRYDTLEGHIERGAEWFLLTKNHHTGEIRFRIEAGWRPGQFPNWWSRFGFFLLGRHYQKLWHKRAHQLMSEIVHGSASSTLEQGTGKLVHSGPEVIFKRSKA
ncbi:MAG TPA: DUF1990 family protein [Balneolaceae bacterium]